MTQGLISSRYARALLAFADINGEADRVCREAQVLESAIREVPEIQKIVTDPAAVSDTEKMTILRSALRSGEMSLTMERFLALVLRNKREHELRFILHTFTVIYYKSRGISFASVTTAVPAPARLMERIGASMEKAVRGEVVLSAETDPSIIGGTVIRLDGIRLDASVAGQLATLRKEFTQRNKRIV